MHIEWLFFFKHGLSHPIQFRLDPPLSRKRSSSPTCTKWQTGAGDWQCALVQKIRNLNGLRLWHKSNHCSSVPPEQMVPHPFQSVLQLSTHQTISWVDAWNDKKVSSRVFIIIIECNAQCRSTKDSGPVRPSPKRLEENPNCQSPLHVQSATTNCRRLRDTRLQHALTNL